jgi:hypothetical protein
VKPVIHTITEASEHDYTRRSSKRLLARYRVLLWYADLRYRGKVGLSSNQANSVWIETQRIKSVLIARGFADQL